MAVITPLKRVLDEEGRKQRWLASQIGRHESDVSRFVNGLIPDDATQQAIADALQRDVSSLFPTSTEEAA